MKMDSFFHGLKNYIPPKNLLYKIKICNFQQKQPMGIILANHENWQTLCNINLNYNVKNPETG